MLRQCKRCFEYKAEDEFSRKTKTQLHSYCKSCVREHSKQHYRENSKSYQDRVDAKKSKLRKLVEELKTNKPCMDCKIIYPSYVLDFDHREDETKVAEISNLVNNGNLESLLEEIAKCDIVCSNCHRERTHRRSKLRRFLMRAHEIRIDD